MSDEVRAPRALGDRLRRLRGDAGTTPPSASRPGALALASSPALRVRRSERALRRGAAPDDDALAARLGAVRIARGVLERTSTWAPGARHGTAGLGPPGESALAWFGPETHPGAWLFLDTETTGLAGGTGTVAFVVGGARFDAGGGTVTQLLLTRFEGEAAMLERLGELLGRASVLGTYNGKSFDVPLLESRYRLAGLGSPFGRLAHVDLLHAVRRSFRGRWSDHRLGTVEARLLGFARAGDIEGHAVPTAWFAWLKRFDPVGLERVLEHNRLDLLSVVALPAVLATALSDPRRADADLAAAARMHLERADAQAAFAHLLAHRDALDAPGLRLLARLARRRGERALATRLWRRLARDGDPEAIEKLAMHHEHVSKDIARALALTRALHRREPAERHRHRERRLMAKLARREEPPPLDG